MSILDRFSLAGKVALVTGASSGLGMRVNAVAPGSFSTEMTEQIPRDKLEEFIANTSTLGRMGEQHELDSAVVFLASPASSYIAGVTLAVDGGMSGH